jgi:hypothetical protein
VPEVYPFLFCFSLVLRYKANQSKGFLMPGPEVDSKTTPVFFQVVPSNCSLDVSFSFIPRISTIKCSPVDEMDENTEGPRVPRFSALYENRDCRSVCYPWRFYTEGGWTFKEVFSAGQRDGPGPG